MSRLARILPFVAALAIAACSSSASPTQPIAPGSAAHDAEYAPDGTFCVSGYNVAQGRCN